MLTLLSYEIYGDNFKIFYSKKISDKVKVRYHLMLHILSPFKQIIKQILFLNLTSFTPKKTNDPKVK